MNIEDWRSQLRRGTLEYCILLMLHRRPCYGYEILQRLGRCAVTTATESTVYPLLRRLQKEGCLTASWQDTAEGLPPRKYYALTPAGEGVTVFNTTGFARNDVVTLPGLELTVV